MRSPARGPLALVLLLLFGGGRDVVMGETGAGLEAGAAVADVTPDQWPLALRGAFHPQLAESAHDPLAVRAVVLDDGQTAIAIAVVDSCMVGRDVLDRAKTLASESTGIPPSRMLVAATHTHSAPFADAAHGTPQELAYQEKLVGGIAEAIREAHTARRPAQAGWASHPVPDEVFNRRWFLKPGTMPENPFGETSDLVKMNPGTGPNLINPAGPTDPEVSVLSLRDAEGVPLALLANYSLHYVGHIPGGAVSADYFGEFARLVGTRLRRPPDSGFVGILSNGTSGDINNINFRNPRPPREPFEQVRTVAGKVADAAFQASAAAAHHRQVPLGMAEREVTLKLRVPTPEQVEKAKARLAADTDPTGRRLSTLYARRVLALAEMGESVDALIQVVRIGDLAICTLPFEVFVEIGLELKEASPFEKTFVIELANGALGYLPTPEQHQLGGYETWLSTNKVQTDASQILVRELTEMLADLAETP